MTCKACAWAHQPASSQSCCRCGSPLIEGEREHDPAWLFRKEPANQQYWNKLKAATGLTKAALFDLMSLARSQESFGIPSGQPNKERWLFFCFDTFSTEDFDTLFASELLNLQAQMVSKIATPKHLRDHVLISLTDNIRFVNNYDDSKFFAWLNSTIGIKDEEFWFHEYSEFLKIGFAKYVERFELLVSENVGSM